MAETLGRACIFPGDDKPAVTAVDVCIVRPSREAVDALWLCWVINSPQVRKYIDSQQAGTTRKRISRRNIAATRLPVPPLPEQHRIVAEIEKHFTRLDAAVASLQRARSNLKRYRASVLKAACEGRLVPTEAELARREGRAYEPASVLLERILGERRAQWEARPGGKGKYKEPQPLDASTLPPLPEGWVWASLDSIATQVADVDHKMPTAVMSGLPYVSPKDFSRGNGIDFDGAKLISREDFEMLSRKVQPAIGDILLSRYGIVGQVRLVKDSIKFQASYSIAIIKPLRLAPLSEFTAVVLRSDFAQAQMQQSIRASHQPTLAWSRSNSSSCLFHRLRNKSVSWQMWSGTCPSSRRRRIYWRPTSSGRSGCARLFSNKLSRGSWSSRTPAMSQLPRYWRESRRSGPSPSDAADPTSRERAGELPLASTRGCCYDHRLHHRSQAVELRRRAA